MLVNPTITIITPTLNAGHNIEACILSVATQSYQNIEHLIIDGLSTDNTLAIVKEYAEQYPHIKFITEKDSGIYDAMNKGIDLASGEWIYFLGSDDLFYSETVLEEIFSVEEISQYDFVYGNVVWGDTGTIYDGKFSLLKLIHKNICHQAIFYKNTIFKLLGSFDTEYKTWADWLFNIRCFSCEEIKTKYFDILIAKFTFGGQSSQLIVDESFLANKASIFEEYIPSEYISISEEISALKNKIDEKDKKISELYSELSKKDNTISEITESISWKITAPVRKIVSFF